MFFAIWGIAVGAGLPWAREWLARRFAFIGEPSGYRLVNGVVILFMAIMALYPAVVRPALVYVMTAEARNPQWRGYGRVHLHPDWRAAGLALQPMIQQADVVVGTDEVAGYYGLDRLDYLFRRTYSTRQGELEEFELHRGAIPVFSSAESLDRLIACNATGLVFVERQYLGRDWTGIPQVMDCLDTRLARLTVPEEWGFVVFHWERAEPVATTMDCALPRLGPTGPTIPRSRRPGCCTTTRAGIPFRSPASPGRRHSVRIAGIGVTSAQPEAGSMAPEITVVVPTYAGRIHSSGVWAP
jgi:hypothetical protein